MLVIQNGNVFSAGGDGFVPADILIEGNKIAKVGRHLEVPTDAKVIDATDLYVLPGLVDAHSHIGGFGAGNEQDLNEMTDPATPAVEARYAIDTKSKEFAEALAAGITTSVIAPGSGNVIGGVVCAVKNAGNSIGTRLLSEAVAMKMALGGNPKGVYGPRNQRPMTRMGIAQTIVENLEKAKRYMKKQEAAGDDLKKQPEYDAGLENLARVLRQEIPIKVHCEQFDMMTTLAIAEQFNIRFTLDHAWGASDYYDEIANAKNLVGVIFGPIGVILLPGECGKIDIECLAELDRRGVLCAIMTDGPIMHPDLLITQTGEAVRTGTPHHRALNMITINAAKIAGIDHRVGSIEVGKDADLAIFRGIPALETRATCVHTIVDGTTVYLEGENTRK